MLERRSGRGAGGHGGSRPAGRADARRSRILGCARSARPGRARSPGRTRRQQAGIDAQRPAKRPQQAHDLRRGGEQRHHLRIAQQMRQLSAVTDRLRTRQPDEPGEIPRQTLRRRLRRVGFRLSRRLGQGRTGSNGRDAAERDRGAETRNVPARTRSARTANLCPMWRTRVQIRRTSCGTIRPQGTLCAATCRHSPSMIEAKASVAERGGAACITRTINLR